MCLIVVFAQIAMEIMFSSMNALTLFIVHYSALLLFSLTINVEQLQILRIMHVFSDTYSVQKSRENSICHYVSVATLFIQKLS
jgi:hypothetical protein